MFIPDLFEFLQRFKAKRKVESPGDFVAGVWARRTEGLNLEIFDPLIKEPRFCSIYKDSTDPLALHNRQATHDKDLRGMRKVLFES